jgi:ribonuclease Y
VLKEAERYAEAVKKESAVEAKDLIFQAKADAEKDFKERRADLNQVEKRLQSKEESLDKKYEQIEKKEASLAGREGNLTGKERAIAEKEARIAELEAEQNKMMEKIAGLSTEEAKAEIFRRVEEQAKFESAKLAKRIEDEARESADKRGKEIIGNSIQRYSSDFVSDATVSSVALPNDELKGRIIGREGRNIRALEAATGVDLIVDDTPEMVTLSAFDPVRRETARLSLERLISDGRIHPARIEEVVEKARSEVEAIILEEGEKAVFELGLAGIHPDIIKTLGRLKYRTSYGQNVLQHSKEVAFIAGMLASELGVDVKLAKRGGLLHDIGKAIDHEVEGTHHSIGSALAKKCGEKDMVVNCIAAHHGDVEVECAEAALVAAADALSAARPGVRRESIENYIQRLETLEKMAKSYDGIDKCYAIQAGREVRLIVKPESVSDELSWTIARELAAKIEQEMTYPGQIKVTVIRESRFVEYAK